jgi:hypothetical protein
LELEELRESKGLELEELRKSKDQEIERLKAELAKYQRG